MRDPKDIIIDGKSLSAILESHASWIRADGGKCADLLHADLQDADLQNANLMSANLYGAGLKNADLRGADLQNANLMSADLRGANLHGADLQGANLMSADLQDANLRGANLRGADLQGANLQDAKNAKIAIASVTITPEGDIIGWKKCRDDVIVKLLIPAESKRSNATGRKCRAEYVKVLEVFGAKYGITNRYGPKTEYRVGEIVKADSWDDNRWNECSHGIHFWITRQEAEDYNC